MNTEVSEQKLMFLDPRRSLVISGILLLGAAIMFCLIWSTAARSVVQEVDDAFMNLMEAIRVQPLTWFVEGLAIVSGTWVNWSVRIAVLVVLTWRRQWLHFSAFVLALITSELLIGPTKELFDRPRPDSLVATTGAAFPSGHAIAATVTSVGLVIALLHPGHKRWVWERQAVVYAALIALSRTYLGAHWLSDVIGGALLGGAIALGWPALLVILREKYLARRGALV